MKVLHLSGIPYEPGRQLGRNAADLIREDLALAGAQRQRLGGSGRADCDAVTRRNERWVSRVFPELLEEVSGLAEGAHPRPVGWLTNRWRTRPLAWWRSIIGVTFGRVLPALARRRQARLFR